MMLLCCESAVMLSVENKPIMLSVVMLSAMAPLEHNITFC